MKKQIFSRKKALVSSLVMLLVAMIALGTATFAWFTNSTSASVSGMTVSVNASEGLLVRASFSSSFADDPAWKGTFDLEADNIKLNPVSGVAGTGSSMSFYALTCDSDAKVTGFIDNPAAVANTAGVPSSAAGYYIPIYVQAKSVGTTTSNLQQTTIEADNTLSGKAQIGVGNVTGGSFTGIFNTDATTTKYYALSGVPVSYVSGALSLNTSYALPYDTPTEDILTEVTPIAATTATNVATPAQLNAAGGVTLVYYVYVEGQKVNPELTTLTGDITLSFDLVAPTP